MEVMRYIEIVLSIIFLIIILGYFFTMNESKSFFKSRLCMIALCVISVSLLILTFIKGEVPSAFLYAVIAIVTLVSFINSR